MTWSPLNTHHTCPIRHRQTFYLFRRQKGSWQASSMTFSASKKVWEEIMVAVASPMRAITISGLIGAVRKVRPRRQRTSDKKKIGILHPWLLSAYLCRSIWIRTRPLKQKCSDLLRTTSKRHATITKRYFNMTSCAYLSQLTVAKCLQDVTSKRQDNKTSSFSIHLFCPSICLNFLSPLSMAIVVSLLASNLPRHPHLKVLGTNSLRMILKIYILRER